MQEFTLNCIFDQFSIYIMQPILYLYGSIEHIKICKKSL